MAFPVPKLVDYNDMAALEKSSNPFAIVVMGYLKTLETRHILSQKEIRRLPGWNKQVTQ